MVRDVDILHLGFNFFLLGLGKEVSDLLLHLVALGHVALTKLLSVLQEQVLELKSRGPLSEELGILLLLEPSGCSELLTPPWRVCLPEGAPHVLDIWIVDDLLIVVGLAEGPDVVLIETVVERGRIRIRRVRVERLTLGVVPNELLISIGGWDDRGGTHSAALFRHEWLQTLRIISVVQLDVIHVVQLHWVVDDRLVETREWVVQADVHPVTLSDGTHAQMETVVNLESSVLHVLILAVDIRSIFGTSEALLLTVLVDAPQVVHTIVD